MVEQLENEIAAYEMETGRPPTHVSTLSGSGSFSGYTASLITAVTKLMGYLKEVQNVFIYPQGFDGLWKTGKVITFNKFIFQAWKIMVFKCHFWKVMENKHFVW